MVSAQNNMKTWRCGHKRFENTERGGCKLCKIEKRKQWGAAHQERVKEIRRQSMRRHRKRNNITRRKWRGKNREEVNLKKRQRRLSNLIKARQMHIKRMRKYRFGPGAVEYREVQLKRQKGLCDICLTVFNSTPHQDHDHECCSGRCCGKCRRGLLCSRCNTVLGHVEEILLFNPGVKARNKWFLFAQKYLLKWKKIHGRVKACSVQ